MKNGSHFSIFFSGIPTGLLPEIFIAKIYFLWEIRYNGDINFHTAICAEASQSSFDATIEIAYANFYCAIPTQNTLRNGVCYGKRL